MNEEARVLVAECMFQQQAHAGQSVIKQGEQGDIVYALELTRLELTCLEELPRVELS